MAKAKAKSKGKKKGKQAKLSKGKKRSKATKSKARKGSMKKKAATKKKRKSAPARISAPEPVPSYIADTTPEVPTFATDMSQEQSMADESPGPEETSYGEADNSSSSM
jgi:hypothetical protein